MMDDIPELLEGLRRTPTILIPLVESIPGDKLDLRRGDGFWTIAEHVGHLAQVQPMLMERINRFIAEDHPEFIPYLPDKEEEGPNVSARIDIPEALGHFSNYRDKQVALLENLSKSVWQRTAGHPEYDQYSLYILVRHILMHDYWHMYRVEELWLTKDAYLTRLE